MAADDTRELEELLERPLPDRDRAPQAAFSIPEKTAARSLQPLQGTHDLLRHRDRDGDIRLPPPPGDLIPAEHPRFQAHGVADREARPPQDQDKGFQQFPSPFRTVRIELGRPENLLPLVLLERKHLGAFLLRRLQQFRRVTANPPALLGEPEKRPQSFQLFPRRDALHFPAFTVLREIVRADRPQRPRAESCRHLRLQQVVFSCLRRSHADRPLPSPALSSARLPRPLFSMTGGAVCRRSFPPPRADRGSAS